MSFNICESYEWMTPEFTVQDTGKNTIRIRGVAMKANVVSRNKRKYVDEELKKAARTWIGKPVTINHDMNRKVGNITWMEYNRGALEYLADIKKQPYVGLLRDKSTEVKGVSIEANYLHNRCPKCGQRFYSEAEFHAHMSTEHFIKTDPTKEPHGLVGTALSLVLAPEEPGYTGSSIELMEAYRKPVLQLLETVYKTRKEVKEYLKKLEGKAVLTKENRQTYDKQLREQEEDKTGMQPPAHPTEEGGHECEEGMHWDEEAGTCVADEMPTSNIVTAEPPAEKVGEQLKPIIIPKVQVKEQEVHDELLQPVAHPVMKGGHECGEGSHWDEEEGTCVPDLIPEEHTTSVPTTITPKVTAEILPRLKLGEPFAGYTDFQDCVAKNQDKEDAEAYCATIKQKAEGETVEALKESFNVYETLTGLREAVTRLNRKRYVTDVKLAESINKLADTMQNLAVKYDKYIAELRESLSKAVITESHLRHTYNKALQKKLQEIMVHRENVVTQVNKALQQLQTSVNHIKEKAEATGKLATEQKKDFEAILAEADKNMTAATEKIKSLEQWKITKEQEDAAQKEPCPEGQHRNSEGECVPDEPPKTEETKKKLEEMQVKLENLEDKLKKGVFKGHEKQVTPLQSAGVVDDPKRKGRR